MLSSSKSSDTDSWSLAFDHYQPLDEKWREVVLALGNGVWVQRAAAACAPPGALHYPGTYLAGCYEQLNSPIDGIIDRTESLAKLPDPARLTLRIDAGPWLDLDQVKLLDYNHGVCLQRGISWREFSFEDPQGRRTRWREQRVVSMAEPARGGVRVQLTAENWSGALTLRAGIDTDIENTNVERYRGHATRHLEPPTSDCAGPGTLITISRTRNSGRTVAQALRLSLNGALAPESECEITAAEARLTVERQCQRGQSLVVELGLVLCDASDSEEIRPSVQRLIASAPRFIDLYRNHRRAWRQLWQLADIRADHAATQQALRFHIFHLLQTVSPNSVGLDAGVPGRGWHGEGYRGHIFWDELFVLPFIFYRWPALGRALLMYRYRRLDAARAAARAAGFKGAMYPWRSAASGAEVTPSKQLNLLNQHFMDDPTYRERHIGSAVAYNVWHYYLVSGDREFLARHGAEMVLEIARFWASIARWNPQSQRFDISGVIGPDEYHQRYPGSSSPGIDNNAYTNLMAAWTLCRGLDVLDQLTPRRRAELRQQLALGDDELAHWEHVSRRLSLEIRGDGIIEQFRDFSQLPALPAHKLPESASDERVDWVLDAEGDGVDHYQVVKQADTLTVLYLLSLDELNELLARLGYAPQTVDLRRTADYYHDITTHGSSLSQIVYAGAWARMDLEKSWQFYRESLTTDLNALRGESNVDGIHLGAIGGTLDVLQRSYVGISARLDGLVVAPNLPAALSCVSLRLLFRGQTLALSLTPAALTISSGSASVEVCIIHGGQKYPLGPEQQLQLPLARPAPI